MHARRTPLFQQAQILGVRDTTPSWCVVRECGLEPLQFNWFCAAVRLYNSLTQCYSSMMRKVLQADMQMSSRLQTAGPPTFFQPWKA
jgi:hypothetical protein